MATWPWTEQAEQDHKKFEEPEKLAAYMSEALQKKAVIRLTFTFEEQNTQGVPDCVDTDTACIQFHRKVSRVSFCFHAESWRC